METWTRRALKEHAKIRVRANYWKAVLVGVLATIISGGIMGGASATSIGGTNPSSSYSGGMDEAFSSIPSDVWIAILILIVLLVVAGCAIAVLLKVLVINPLEIGYKRFFYRNLTENADVKEVCYTYDMGYKNGVSVLFFRDLYVLLWSLLLIVPGIIKSYEYRMMPYILSENPDMSKEEVFALSKQMMTGNKWKAFVLDLSFIGWDILGALTLGILNVFYIVPYKMITDAGLYRALKKETVLELR